MIKQVLVKNAKEFNHGGGFRPSDTGGGAISNLSMKWSHSAPRPYEPPLGVKNKGGWMSRSPPQDPPLNNV